MNRPVLLAVGFTAGVATAAAVAIWTVLRELHAEDDDYQHWIQRDATPTRTSLTVVRNHVNDMGAMLSEAGL